MSRLTTRHCGVAVIKDKNKLKEAMEKLAAYEEQEEQMIRPGDTIYVPIQITEEVLELQVSKIIIGTRHDQISCKDKSVFTIWGKKWNECIGTFIFKTEEAAKQALEENKRKQNSIYD